MDSSNTVSSSARVSLEGALAMLHFKDENLDCIQEKKKKINQEDGRSILGRKV